MTKAFFFVTIVAVATTFGADAMAKGRRASTVVTETDQGYGYDFKDDVLQAGVGGTNGVIIRIRDTGVRRTLIRPRTHFVPEMLKSVETI